MMIKARIRSLAISAAALYLVSIVHGQTHVSPALDNANVFTNTNQFAVGITPGPSHLENMGRVRVKNALTMLSVAGQAGR